MQRQSLGSPSSKLVKDEQLSSETQKQLSTSTLGGSLYGEECKEEKEEELKKLKPRTTMPESYIHFIPILTLLCFLILYLSSHHPSQNDLAQFNGLNTFNTPAEESISELQLVEIKKGDILAIRSLKNLKQEADAAKHRRLHRKIADF